jgi:integrase
MRMAWVCSYTDANGTRRLRTFGRKSEAKDFEAVAATEFKKGVHTPESQSVTASEAAELWLDDCAARGLERSTLAQYEQHVDP